MSSRPTIATIANHDGQEVTLNGWLYNIRGSGKIAFPQLRDGLSALALEPLDLAAERRKRTSDEGVERREVREKPLLHR